MILTEFEAILSLMPNAKITYEEGKVKWHDNTQVQPSTQEIANELARLKTIQELSRYKDLRALEYPSIGDQLDALFHAGVFPEYMATQLQAIKNKYPKPE